MSTKCDNQKHTSLESRYSSRSPPALLPPLRSLSDPPSPSHSALPPFTLSLPSAPNVGIMSAIQTESRYIPKATPADTLDGPGNESVTNKWMMQVEAFTE